MAKYVDAEKLKELISQVEKEFIEKSETKGYTTLEYRHKAEGLHLALQFIDSLHQEQPIPDSTHLIAEWEKEKAVLEQKDFRGDAERMAFNAFLDGLIKGLEYDGTR